MDSGKLLELAKRKLRIDGADESEDVRIGDIIESSDAALRDALAIHDKTFSFEVPGAERDLFLARCFYEYNDALDDFLANYATEIATVRQGWLGRQYAEENAVPAI